MLWFSLLSLLAFACASDSVAALPLIGDASRSLWSQTKSSFWQPKAGTTFQIVLQGALKDTSTDVTAFDIDLIANDVSTIRNLHSKGRKVICYFSAGSYEDFRPDSKDFQASDYGNPLDGWAGEWWLNTKSANVRKIMVARLDLAKSKGCDAVDPDNVDSYSHDTGFSLTKTDSVDYLKFLAQASHSRGMAIGLKNAGEIILEVADLIQFAVNEQCNQYEECEITRPFITAGKPVFHIEYPAAEDERTKDSICDDPAAKGFSTLLKHMELDEWYDACPAS